MRECWNAGMLECWNAGMRTIYRGLEGRRIGGLEKAGIDFTGGHRERRGRLRDGVKLETKKKAES